MTSQVLRLPAVIAKTGLSRSTLYQLMQRGEFPRSFKLASRSVGWMESDVEAWLRNRHHQTHSAD